MRRFTSVVLTATLLGALGQVPPAGAAKKDVQYKDDKLTASLEGVPLSEVIAELGRQSGAEVSGEVKEQRDVTTEIDAVPLKEALERLLRNQNFTLVYAADGKLKAIELKELREEEVRKRADSKTALQENGDRPFERMAFVAFDERERVPVEGRLAERLGDTKVRWDLLANTAFADESPAIRRAAVRAAVRAFEADPDLKAAVVEAFDGVGEADIAAFARARCHHRAEDFVRNIARATTDPELRAQAQAVLHQLKRNPWKGPKPVEGSAQAAMH